MVATILSKQLRDWRDTGRLGQLIRFVATGLGVTAVYAALYWPLATYVMNPNLAVAIAFVLATIVGRFAHGAISFAGHGRRDRATVQKFFAVQTLGFALNQLFTWIAVTGPFLHGPTWWPLVPAVFVTPLVTFELNRRWVFA